MASWEEGRWKLPTLVKDISPKDTVKALGNAGRKAPSSTVSPGRVRTSSGSSSEEEHGRNSVRGWGVASLPSPHSGATAPLQRAERVMIPNQIFISPGKSEKEIGCQNQKETVRNQEPP